MKSGSRLESWFLPAPLEDEPRMELGPPPLELADGVRSYTMVRLAAACLAMLVHAAMGAITGWSTWWLVAGLSVIHTLVAVPFGSEMARRRPIVTLVADGGAMLVATLIVGDPVVLVFWMPMLLLSTLVYLGGRTGKLGVAYVALIVAVAFGARRLGLIDTELDGDVIRVYALLSVMALGSVAYLYLYAVGGAVRRKDRALNLAEQETQRARRQADIRAAQLEAVFEHAPIGLALQDAESRFLYVNPRGVEILGIAREEILRGGVVPTLLPDSRHLIESQISDCRASGAPFRIEYPIRTPDGVDKWIAHAGHAIELEGGTGSVSTLEDLTATFQATTRSRRFAAALEVTEDLVVIWDGTGVLLHANRAFQRFWTTPADPTGTRLAAVVGDHNARLWTDRAEDGVAGATEVEIACADGRTVTMSLLVHRSEPNDHQLPVYTAALRDISAIAEARRQLEGLLQSKDQFIASVSHELRTPLAAVMGMAQLLADDLHAFGADEVRELTRHIADQSSDLAALVEDLLTAARADAGVLTIACEPVAVDRMVTEALQSLPPDLREGVRVSGTEGLEAVADPTRGRQIVRNLLTNARRYGGPVVEIIVEEDRGVARLVVRDSGPPVPEEARERMFEAYGRAHQRVGTPDSVGLGLTVSRRLARMMGGDVAYHHDGEWSVFTVTLPLHRSVVRS